MQTVNTDFLTFTNLNQTKDFGDNFISSPFSSNSEAFASELLENREEMLPRCYTYILISSVDLNLQSHYSMLPVAKLLINGPWILYTW